MSRYKDYLMDWQNKIHEIEGYEDWNLYWEKHNVRGC